MLCDGRALTSTHAFHGGALSSDPTLAERLTPLCPLPGRGPKSEGVVGPGVLPVGRK